MPFGLKGSIIMRSVLQNSSHPIPLSVHRMESGGVSDKMGSQSSHMGPVAAEKFDKMDKKSSKRSEKGKGQRAKER